MASNKAKVLTQLSLYRKYNIRDIERRFESTEHTLSDNIGFILQYLRVFPETVIALSKAFTGNRDNAKKTNYDYRNTDPRDMDATNFNLLKALGSLKRMQEFKRGGINHEGRAHYSTGTQNRKMRESKLPSNRLTRAASLAGLVLDIASSTTKDALKRYLKGENTDVFKNALSSDENIRLVVDCLCKMRGTALKFGQLLSLQYDILPENFRKALISARQEADIMPRYQVDTLMAGQFGKSWMSNFLEFEFEPMASASLGQAHRGKLLDGTDVVVKIQFPGVLDSIESDMSSLIFLCTRTKLVPEKFFVNQYAKEMEVELTAECNYTNEARFYKIFRQLQLDGFFVPRVIPHLSTSSIITTEFVRGCPVEDCSTMPQEIRDSIGERLLRLGLSEIFIFGLMNTDPNPSNYLYDKETDTIGLIDFGSCRIYKPEFIKEYFSLVLASARVDHSEIVNRSLVLGFLHPEDCQETIDAHLDSVLLTGEPFRHDGFYDFGKSDIVKRCLKNSKVILKLRHRPPPPEVYSLHRKLAGCYAICKLLSSRIDAKRLFDEIVSLSNFND